MKSKASLVALVALAAGALLSIGAGCELIVSPNRSLIGDGGAGGTVSTGGNTGGGGGPVCNPADCPAATADCMVAVCNPDGSCGEGAAPAGTPSSMQTAGDCHELQCDGMGGTTDEIDDTDAPDDGLDCTVNTCNMGTPEAAPETLGTACDDPPGATVCDDMGSCVECNVVGDCPSDQPYECNNHICVPLTCINVTLDPGETDVDCGGMDCPPCADNLNCLIPADCQSGVCEDVGMGLKCQPPACDDMVLNGDETDVDCGGLPQAGHDCSPCKTGQDCKEGTDCVGLECSGMGGATGQCIANCFDNEQNNDETDADCGGLCTLDCDVGQGCNGDMDCVSTTYCDTMVCTLKKLNGVACAGGNQCESAFCTDGVCCNSMCGATCQACTAALKGGGSDGQCGTIAQDTDPENECAGAGVCDGLGGCKKAVGETCMMPDECSSGFCADGVCCSTACTGGGNTCKACSMAKTGQADGTCANVTMGTDPDSECAGATTCNAGACELFMNGTACTIGGECTSTFCANGFCCNNACTNNCLSCAMSNTGVANGTCALTLAGQDPDNDCNGTNDVCDGGGSCKQSNGTTCGNNPDCASGFCVDSVCCQTQCNGNCVGCSMAKTGMTSGLCNPITMNTDPDNDCPGNDACSGGVCKLGMGDACTANGDCASNSCVGNVCQ